MQKEDFSYYDISTNNVDGGIEIIIRTISGNTYIGFINDQKMKKKYKVFRYKRKDVHTDISSYYVSSCDLYSILKYISDEFDFTFPINNDKYEYSDVDIRCSKNILNVNNNPIVKILEIFTIEPKISIMIYHTTAIKKYVPTDVRCVLIELFTFFFIWFISTFSF